MAWVFGTREQETIDRALHAAVIAAEKAASARGPRVTATEQSSDPAHHGLKVKWTWEDDEFSGIAAGSIRNASGTASWPTHFGVRRPYWPPHSVSKTGQPSVFCVESRWYPRPPGSPRRAPRAPSSRPPLTVQHFKDTLLGLSSGVKQSGSEARTETRATEAQGDGDGPSEPEGPAWEFDGPYVATWSERASSSILPSDQAAGVVKLKIDDPGPAGSAVEFSPYSLINPYKFEPDLDQTMDAMSQGPRAPTSALTDGIRLRFSFVSKPGSEEFDVFVDADLSEEGSVTRDLQHVGKLGSLGRLQYLQRQESDVDG